MVLLLCRRESIFGAARVVALAALLSSTARAGGGPENLMLVVNARSESSQRIANHYIQWRGIPGCNVVYLDWKRGLENCRAEHFREEILQPAIAAIKDRELVRQIDYLVYSSDFPWRVDFRHVHTGKLPVSAKPFASLSGATYLWHYVELESRQLLSLQSNRYVAISSSTRNPTDQIIPVTRSRAFRSQYQWGPSGQRVSSGGQHYLLSTMLAVTTGRGNTVDEALRYLRRAVSADAQPPNGTVYFMKNGDVRSKARHGRFPAAVQELRSLGVAAQVVDGVLPEGKKDIAGLMVGAREFDLDKAKVRIQPGAICEHLTSYGGILLKNHYQTPLSVFLRHGAAGASGTVIEPTALQQKFPLPTIHVHYARGCSLAESFYQSVAAPWQLLIVGDPLCQPWAVPPTVQVPEMQAGQRVSGMLEVTPTVEARRNRKIYYIALFVDGKLRSYQRPAEAFQIDTTKLADGHHELRFVAVDTSPVACQGRSVLPIWVDNHGRMIDLEVQPAARDGRITLSVRSPGSSRIVIRQNHRRIGTVTGAEGQLEIPSRKVGRGPVTFWAVGEGDVEVFSRPVETRID